MEIRNDGFETFFGAAYYGSEYISAQEILRIMANAHLPSDVIFYKSKNGMSPKKIRKEAFFGPEILSESGNQISIIFESKKITNKIPWVYGIIFSNDSHVVFFHIAFSCSSVDQTIKELFGEVEAVILNNGIKYGYYFSDADTNDPFYFPAGIASSYGTKRDPSGLPLMYWSNGIALPNGRKPYDIGIIRDIFKVNIITSVHLNSIINGIALHELITKDERFGTLEFCGIDTWKWIVNSDNLKFVRASLTGCYLLSLKYCVDNRESQKL